MPKYFRGAAPPDSRTTWSYEIVDGKPTDIKYRRTVEDLNQDGSISRTLHYGGSGAVERMYETLATDDKGSIVEQRIYYDYYEVSEHRRFLYEDHDYYVIKREAMKPEEAAAVLKYHVRPAGQMKTERILQVGMLQNGRMQKAGKNRFAVGFVQDHHQYSVPDHPDILLPSELQYPPPMRMAAVIRGYKNNYRQ